MCDAQCITPVPLSKLQNWTKGKRMHPSSRGDLSNWDAYAALRNFNIPFLCFEDWEGAAGAEKQNLPPLDVHTKVPQSGIGTVFQPENTQFIFVTFGKERFLIVDGPTAPFTMVQARFIDFGR